MSQQPQSKPRSMHTIAIFPKIQSDTTIAIFLLSEFGEKFFPGISKAKIEFWTALPKDKTAVELEAQGILPIDLGGGTFDHHHTEHGKKKTESVATIIAKYLGVRDRPELKKLLAFALRCDLEGKGIISKDPLDRAFGFPGLISAMNRVYQDKPELVLGTALPLIRAHYLEEYKRQVEMPKEWKQMEKDGTGWMESWETRQGKFKIAVYESTNTSLAGFLRAFHKCDFVIQRFPSGHTNIITRQQQGRTIDWRSVIRVLRAAEAERVGTSLAHLSREALEAPGRIEEAPEWFFDTAANTLQNGGVSPQDTPATRLSLREIAEIVREALGNK